jgi:DUF438 domain-containing protein
MSEYIDNVSKRKEQLKQALKKLHEGTPLDELRAEFTDVLQNASAGEIAQIEQSLIQEGLPVEEIQNLCDIHVSLFREGLDKQPTPDMQAGHPLYTFRAENELASLVLNEVKAAIVNFKVNPSAEVRTKLSEKLQKLMEFEKHYTRKEHYLFPFLEKYQFTGPSSVMWGIQDDIRKGWKAMRVILQSPALPTAAMAADLEKTFSPIENAIREMFYKEERILFPASLERLTQKDWEDIYDQEAEIGFSYITRGNQWRTAAVPQSIEDKLKLKQTQKEKEKTMTSVPLKTGALTPEQLSMMLTTLPLDIAYVDENDTVLFYSETKDRIFRRTPAVIGRKVQNCHPPASVNKVIKILEDFRAAKRDKAEFWIQMDGKFIYICYFAVRDGQGAYRGTLEVTQDLTHLREIQGEKRLLED